MVFWFDKIRIGGKKENSIGKVVFLTFDDGLNHIITPKILDVLKEKKVPATFFVVGRLVNDKTKDVLERELKEGHSIALHSYTHEYSTLYPNRIAKSEAIINEAKKTEPRARPLTATIPFSVNF